MANREVLEKHLETLSRCREDCPLDMSFAILANPQAHIDALVEAGVLHVEDWQDHATYARVPVYRVVQPHKHEWRVGRWPGAGGGPSDTVTIECDCGEVRHVPNRLPIEVPE